MDLIQSMLEAEKEAGAIIAEAEATSLKSADQARQESQARILKVRQETLAAGEAHVAARKAEALAVRHDKVEAAAVAVEEEIRQAAGRSDTAIAAFTKELVG